MRQLLGTIAIAVFAVVAAACPPRGDSARGGASVTARDSVRCGSTKDIYKNHTTLAKELFVRVSHDCLSEEVPSLDVGRVLVADSAGNVVNRQEEDLSPGETHRGSFLVPGGATLRVECPEHITLAYGCPYSYTLTVRF